jgi:phosphopentomutase
VFLHFNTPHAPYFYDAKADRFDASGRGISGYSDALELVDRTVAQLIKHLDSNTVLLLSADHPLRIADQVDGITDPHVPFIVHFPGQTDALRDEQEFSSLRTAPLILEILNGSVRTPQKAAEFLNQWF